MKGGNPPRHRFLLPVQVRYADTDAQGHVFFANYMTYCDEGFTAYLREIGFGWDIVQSMGMALYYVKASCHFKSPAFFENVLHVHTRVTHLGNTSFTGESTIYKSDSDCLVATGEIIAVTVTQETGKKTPIPDLLRHAVKSYEGNP